MNSYVHSSTIFKPIIIFKNYDRRGELRSIVQYIDRNTEKQKSSLIPIWCVALFCYLFAALLIIFGASLYVFFSQRPALYNESCINRSCKSGLQMLCINGTCSCLPTQYYLKGCKNKADYLQQCLGHTSYCVSNRNFVCKDGVCECNKTSYWNGSTCIGNKGYGVSCLTNNDCSIGTQMICDLSKKKCLCSSDRYKIKKLINLKLINYSSYRFWDGIACIPLRTINEVCSKIIKCSIVQNLVCQAGVCT